MWHDYTTMYMVAKIFYPDLLGIYYLVDTLFTLILLS